MKGYNYDELYGYANALKDRLINSGKGRIKDVYLLGESNNGFMFNSRKKVYRNWLKMDKYYLTKTRSDVGFAYGEARKYSRSSSPFQTAYINGTMTPVSVKSQQSDKYDYWNFVNAPLKTHSGVSVKMKDFSTISREVTDNTISREDQQYVINVGYDFIGNYELGQDNPRQEYSRNNRHASAWLYCSESVI